MKLKLQKMWAGMCAALLVMCPLFVSSFNHNWQLLKCSQYLIRLYEGPLQASRGDLKCRPTDDVI